MYKHISSVHTDVMKSWRNWKSCTSRNTKSAAGDGGNIEESCIDI